MKIQLYYSYLPASQLFKESMDILMSPEPSTSTQNHEVCVECTILQEEVTRNNQQMGDFQKNEDFVWHRGWNFKLDKLT